MSNQIFVISQRLEALVQLYEAAERDSIRMFFAVCGKRMKNTLEDVHSLGRLTVAEEAFGKNLAQFATSLNVPLDTTSATFLFRWIDEQTTGKIDWPMWKRTVEALPDLLNFTQNILIREFETDCDKLFAHIDANNSGAISGYEFSTSVQREPTRRNPHVEFTRQAASRLFRWLTGSSSTGEVDKHQFNRVKRALIDDDSMPDPIEEKRKAAALMDNIEAQKKGTVRRQSTLAIDELRRALDDRFQLVDVLSGLQDQARRRRIQEVNELAQWTKEMKWAEGARRADELVRRFETAPQRWVATDLKGGFFDPVGAGRDGLAAAPKRPKRPARRPPQSADPRPGFKIRLGRQRLFSEITTLSATERDEAVNELRSALKGAAGEPKRPSETSVSFEVDTARDRDISPSLSAATEPRAAVGTAGRLPPLCIPGAFRGDAPATARGVAGERALRGTVHPALVD